MPLDNDECRLRKLEWSVVLWRLKQLPIVQLRPTNGPHVHLPLLPNRIALDRGLREDALRVALRLVVGRPQHAGAKALLASCIQVGGWATG